MESINLPVAKFRNILIIFGTTISLFYYLTRVEGNTSGYILTAFSLIALSFVLYSLKTLIKSLGGGPTQLSYWFIFFGITSSVIGQLLWTYYTFTNNLFYANTIPPILFFITYILNFVGFIKLGLLAQIKIREFMGTIIGFGILGIVLTTIANATHPLSFSLINSGYLLGDSIRIIIIALMLQMVIIYQGGMLGRYWLSIFVGNMFIFIGNFAASILFKEYASGLWPFNMIELIFISGYLFVAHGFYGIGDSIRFALNKIAEHKQKK